MPVTIHGKEYKTVAERLAEFHKDIVDHKSIITEIIQFKDGIVVVKAVVKIGENVFCGHAYEDIGSSKINETSALENCETSAIGRALASSGYAGTEFCSADELVTALNKQNAPSKPQKVDLSDDNWRDLTIGYKAEKKKDLTWKTAEEEDLIWIVESGPDKWKPLAKEELNLRSQERINRIKKEAATEEADELFA
mgnify:CR=1 FL=1